MSPRTAVGVATVARSDYGILKPVLEGIEASPKLKLYLYVTGMHLSPEFGRTASIVESEFEVYRRVESNYSSDSPAAIAKSIGAGTTGFAQCFSSFAPDVFVVMGDRFEMFAPAIAALPFDIPIAHIHGGEVTQGAIDDSIRHSLTKFSHLHFTSTDTYRQRVIQLGESPDRVFTTGAPGLDNIRQTDCIDASRLADKYDLPADTGYLLVTFHPVTRELDKNREYIRALIRAVDSSGRPVVCTLPNADTEGSTILDELRDFARREPDNVSLVDNFGARDYYSAMQYAGAMVGNSSSGIIEAASFELPVVNIGARQKGRVRGENVIDVDPDAEAISRAIRQALSSAFREKIAGMANPYGDGKAADRIVGQLEQNDFSEFETSKQFFDVEFEE